MNPRACAFALLVAASTPYAQGSQRQPLAPTPTPSALTAGGRIPRGAMILSESATPPIGFIVTGMTVEAKGTGWSSSTSLPQALVHGAAAELDGAIYYAGGSNGVNLATLLRFEPQSGWSNRAPMSGARSQASAAALNGLLYVIGGNAPGVTPLVECYDPLLDQWTTVDPISPARHSLTAQAVNGRIYAIGGYNGASPVATVEEYDPATNNWITRTPMPTARFTMGSAVIGGKIYVVGGSTGTYTSVLEAYDPVSNTWSSHASMTTPRCCLSAAAANGRLYAIGGILSCCSPTVPMSACASYDPVSDSWRPEPLLPTARGYLASVELDNTIYSIGGTTGISLLATVEAFDVGRQLFVHERD